MAYGFAVRPDYMDTSTGRTSSRLPESLVARLMGMTLDNSDLTDGLEEREKAKAEEQLQRQFVAADKRAETNEALRRKARNDQLARNQKAQSLRGDAGVPESVMNGKPQRPLGNTEAEIRRAMTLGKAVQDKTDQSEDDERLARRLHLQGVTQDPSMPESTFGKYVRGVVSEPRQRSQDKGRQLSLGTRIGRSDTGGIRLEGPSAAGTDEEKKMLARANAQLGLTPESGQLNDLSQFKEYTRANSKRIADSAKQSSSVTKNGLMAGRSGSEIPEGADEKFMQGYRVGANQRRSLQQRLTNRPDSMEQMGRGLLASARTPDEALKVMSIFGNLSNMRRANDLNERELALGEKKMNQPVRDPDAGVKLLVGAANIADKDKQKEVVDLAMSLMGRSSNDKKPTKSSGDVSVKPKTETRAMLPLSARLAGEKVRQEKRDEEKKDETYKRNSRWYSTYGGFYGR